MGKVQGVITWQLLAKLVRESDPQFPDDMEFSLVLVKPENQCVYVHAVSKDWPEVPEGSNLTELEKVVRFEEPGA